jgi:hypothetical protein
MRLSRFVMLCFGTAALTACGKDEVTAPTLPPLSAVRFINAVNDTGGVDIRAIDQVELSPTANNLQYQKATEYFPTEAGVRHFRVFPTSTNINVTSQIMADQVITLPAGSRVTLLLAGSARAKTVNLWVINDSPTAPAAGQIGVRLLNAASGNLDGYVTNTTADPMPATATTTNVGPLTSSSYIFRPAGPAAIRVTDAGGNTVKASAAGPASPATLPGELPGAGVSSPGTALSAYYFAAGQPGSPAAAIIAGVLWFVDRNPCDDPPAAACGQ